MAAVEAVVFDVGRVIVEWDLQLIWKDTIPDEAARRHFVATVVTEEWHATHDAGRDLDEMLAERITLFPDHAPHIRRYADRFADSIPGTVPGSVDLIDALAAAGVPLYAITNFAHRFWQEFRPTLPVFRHFRDVVVSGTEKLAKPDPAIFHLAARRFGHAPQAMLFIDDNAANIAAAQALGWQVHHFTDAARLADDLEARALI